MDTNELVKYLIVKNPLYEIGLKDINLLKILQEEIEKPISYKITKPQVKTALELLHLSNSIR